MCLACLAALKRVGLMQIPHEVIVVDNASSDGTGPAIARAFPETLVIRNEVNRGIAAGRNQGIATSRGDCVLILDQDTEVQPNAPLHLLQRINLPGVGIVGARLIGLDGELQYTGRLFPTLWGKVGRRVNNSLLEQIVYREELRDWDHASARDVDYVIGACQLVRREVFESAGVYDERFFYGPDDADFCLRARLEGWRVAYEPRALVIHAERRVTKGVKMDKMLIRHALSVGYYFAKHRYLFSRRRLYSRMKPVRG
jgi:GT2 family glycosyltransferase